MTAQVYEFTAFDPNADNRYTFKAYQLCTGEVLVPEEQAHDSFYKNLSAVEANGNDEIQRYEATGKTVSFTDEELREAVTGSAQEFGIEAIPASLCCYVAAEEER